MANPVPILEMAAEAAAEVAERAGGEWKSVAIQLFGLGTYTNLVQAAAEENPYWALTGAAVGTVIAVTTAPLWVPEAGAVVALTGLSTLSSEIIAGAVGSWGISGATEDVFKLLGELTSANIPTPAAPFSSPSGFAGPAAHETLLVWGRVVGIEVGILLVRLKPDF